jgi:hypothetical protein
MAFKVRIPADHAQGVIRPFYHADDFECGIGNDLSGIEEFG